MRKIIIKILKYFLVGFCILNMSCSTAPKDNIIHMNHFIWQNTTFELIDRVKNEHVYSNFPLLYNNEKATLYCQLHYQWEIITAVYNIEKSIYDYNVIAHSKQF